MHKRLMPPRWLARALATIAEVYLFLSLLAGVVMMDGALHIPRLPVQEGNAFADMVARWADGGVVDATVTAEDGAVLKGWYVRPAKWSGSSVILLHGVGDNRQGIMGYAPMFLRAGYAVLLPDSRAHGESGGLIATYGLLESKDVEDWSRWIDAHATQASRDGQCVYLFGESMGAAITLQATATAAGLCAVVAEAPFSSFREIGYERISQSLGVSVGVSHVVAWPMVNFAFLYARLRYGLNFDEASPERKLADSHVPALLIVGTEDRNIPMRHAERILRLSGTTNELWRVTGAGHTGAVGADHNEFESRVVGWFAHHPRRTN